jgi:YVTN family beta-propeller protein
MKRLFFWAVSLAGLILSPFAFAQKLVGVVGLEGQPSGLAANPVTNMVYVPNTTLGTVTVINGGSNQVVANITLPSTPIGVALNPTTNLIYVTTTSPSNSVVVIDGSSNTVKTTVPAFDPSLVAVNPTTNLIYFANEGGLSVLDGSTNEITDTIPMPYVIQGIAVDQVSNKIYLTETTFPHTEVVVVDGVSNRFASFTIQNACFLKGIAVDSSLNRIYVADNNCSFLYVINGTNNHLLNTILPGYAGPISVNLSNHQVADFGSLPYSLTFVNGKTDKVLNSMNFPFAAGGPMSISAGASNRYYVTFYKGNNLAVISGPQSLPHHTAKR